MKSIIYNRTIERLCRYLLGTLFVFSGLAKGLNPFGLSIQLTEYFSALHLTTLSVAAPFLAILLPAVETLLGFMLFLGLYKRLTAWITAVFMTFFTLLTLWIALYNPVNDCGCFGDLLKLSNWATLGKNLVFSPLALLLIPLSRHATTVAHHQRLKLLLATCASLILPIFTTFTLPLIDATPFKVGVNIPAAMEIPAGAPRLSEETVLIYKNIHTGKEQSFAITDTTWYDTTTWEFIDSRTTTLSEGYQASIPSFPILTDNGSDIHQQVLQSPRLLLIISPSLQDLNVSHLQMLAQTAGVRTILLTAAPLDKTHNLNFSEAYNSDYTLLRTMIQHSDGGVMLLENGTIIAKWAMSELPDKI